MKTKIKICGITTKEDVRLLNEAKVDYAGFVLFYEKSKRNLTIEQAAKLKAELEDTIQTVAVVVSPKKEQILEIQQAGFDYIQIHGTLSKIDFDAISIPIIRAFNAGALERFEEIRDCSKVKLLLFDAKEPGSGETFDWNLVLSLDKKDKPFFLAGGITKENVQKAIETVEPYGVDVSSYVESEQFENGIVGKDATKLKEFIRMVRNGK